MIIMNCAFMRMAARRFTPLSKALRQFPGTARFTPLLKGADGPQASGGILANRPEPDPPAFASAHLEFRAVVLLCRQEGTRGHPMHQSGAHGALRAQRWKIPPRDCVASAPFDKGVNRWLTIPAASTLPANRRRAFDKGFNAARTAGVASPKIGEEPCQRVSRRDAVVPDGSNRTAPVR